MSSCPSSSPSSSSLPSSVPSVRFEGDCTVIPEIGPMKPRLSTRKYSLPLTLRSKPTPALLNDPTFTPSPPGPSFSITLPSLSRSLSRPQQSHNGPLERRRSTGQHTVLLQPEPGNEQDERERYLAEYGVRSCLVRGNGIGRERRNSSGSESGKGCGPPVVSPSLPLIPVVPPTPTTHGNPGSPPQSNSSRSVLSIKRRFSNSLSNGGRHSTVHPGCITEEPEMENTVDAQEHGEVDENPSSDGRRRIRLPSVALSRSISSSISSTSTMGTHGMTTPGGGGKVDNEKIPLRGCCQACERASELGGREEHEWEIEFDKRAREKRDRDEKDKEKNVDVFALGTEVDGDVQVKRMDVVVDEVDCARKGKCGDGVWITTRPGILLNTTPIASSSVGQVQPDCVSPSPNLEQKLEETFSYFDLLPTSGNGVTEIQDSPTMMTPSESIPETKASREEEGVCTTIAPSSKNQTITVVRDSTKRYTGPIEPLPPQPKRTTSNSTREGKRSGGWLGFSVTKALGVM